MTSLQTTVVSVPRADGKSVKDSYFAKPEGSGKLPGLLVIHEAFGLNDNIREIARRLAGQGYAALAVDLFSNRNRTVCMLQAFYGMLFKPLNNPMLADLQSTMKFLGEQPGVDANCLGAVGFCMGGGYALQLAVTSKEMKVASVFYGASPKPLEAMAKACPIVGSYPDKDFTTQMARDLDVALTNYDVPHNIKIYDNTLHSFFARQRTPFEVEASKDAWERMLSFFNEHLA
jgi:carboxymethylenebutenolidase